MSDRPPRVLRALLTTLLLAVVLAPAAAWAAEPPNQNDPCSRGGRDSCGTTGVGSYETYRYGLRWFGDYRRAVPGVTGPTFCLDLRFWYPSRKFDYARRSADGLQNRAGKAVDAAAPGADVLRDPALRRLRPAQRPAGRDALRAPAHGRRRARRGQPRRARAGRAVDRSQRVARDAARYAGPYRLETSLPSATTSLPVRRRTTLTARVVAASGAAVPNVRLELDLAGAGELPKSVRTGADGVARIAFTPTDAKNGVRGSIRSELLAAPQPGDLRAAPRRRRAQRPAPRRARDDARQPRTSRPTSRPRRSPSATTAAPATHHARRAQPRRGDDLRRVRRLACRRRGPPLRTGADARRDRLQRRAGGDDDLQRPARGRRRHRRCGRSGPGWYGYQLVIPSSDDVVGLTTPCGEASELFKVEAQPTVKTQVSAPAIDPGAAVTDTVAVEGLGGEPVTVLATLHGPYAVGGQDHLRGAADLDAARSRRRTTART